MGEEVKPADQQVQIVEAVHHPEVKRRPKRKRPVLSPTVAEDALMIADNATRFSLYCIGTFVRRLSYATRGECNMFRLEIAWELYTRAVKEMHVEQFPMAGRKGYIEKGDEVLRKMRELLIEDRKITLELLNDEVVSYEEAEEMAMRDAAQA